MTQAPVHPASAMVYLMFLHPLLLLLAAAATQAAQPRSGAAPGSTWQPSQLAPAQFLQSLPASSVVSVTQFGGKPNDDVDDGPAIAAALTAAKSRGATAVLLPAGHYVLGTPVSLVSGVALLGQGCGRTRVTRRPGFPSQLMIRLDGVRNVRVQGISFDHNGGPQFTRSLSFRGAGSHEVAFLDNCFTDSRWTGSPLPGERGDRWAIEMSAETSPSSRVWIGRNRADPGMQLTAGGGAGVEVLRIVDNQVRNGRNAGIAVSYQPNHAVFRDVLIARNTIEDAFGLGIYLGPDRPNARNGRFQDVTIADNVIRGFKGRFPHAIYIRANEAATDRITIVRNQLDAVRPGETTAIRFEDNHGDGVRRFTNVLIADNVATGFGRGFFLDQLDGAAVIRNKVSGARAYLIAPETNRHVDLAP